MAAIYCISGFGADERVFSGLDFGGRELRPIPWLIPVEGESMGSYASRMACNISGDLPILVGLSFGGMMAIEIAKQFTFQKIILISSVKNKEELPNWMRWAGKLALDKVLPLKSYQIIEPWENHNLGIENQEERALVSSYRHQADQRYTNWAVHQILHWENRFLPENLIHIHGGKDHIFPIRNIKADHVIPDGGHFMVMNRARQINMILNPLLENKLPR